MKINYIDNIAIYSHGSISRQSDENLKDDKTLQINDDLNSNVNKSLNQRKNDNNDNKKGFFIH